MLKADGRIINLGGKASVHMKPGVSKISIEFSSVFHLLNYLLIVFVSCCQDCYRVQTPGGGGYGVPTGSLDQVSDVGDPPSRSEEEKPQHFAACGSLHNYKMMQESA